MFRAATNVAPKFALAFLNLGASLTVSPQETWLLSTHSNDLLPQALAQWDEAIEALQRSRPLLPEQSPLLPEYYNRLGIALLKRGWADNRLEPVKDAAALLREGASRYPKHREILANLAEASLLCGNFSESVAANCDVLVLVRDEQHRVPNGHDELITSLSRCIQAKRHGVHWAGLGRLEREIATALQRYTRSHAPLNWLKFLSVLFDRAGKRVHLRQ